MFILRNDILLRSLRLLTACVKKIDGFIVNG